MGRPKAALEWHGTTLLARTVDVVGRATGGPVVVVSAPGQALPPLPAGVLVHEDPVEGLGPVQGLAVGLAAAGRLCAEGAFVCSTDLPFLHGAYVRRVLAALVDGVDVVLPVARGFRQPLAAGYRTDLAGRCASLVEQGRLRPAFLYDAVRTLVLDDAGLLADPALAAADPLLESVVNVNTLEEYRAALARPPT
jgi:molybdopterin-guanine dinucleotide biosynthesis protein A